MLSQLNASKSTPPATSNVVSSPLLEAWEPTATGRHHDTSQRVTADWDGSTPYGCSPPQNSSSRASIAGSPPHYQPPLEELRGGFTFSSPHTSPRAAYRQPVPRASDYQSFGEYLGSSPNNKRPPSMHTQNTPYPPLPHHPQAHFYEAPELDFGMSKPDFENRKSLEGCCCVLDSLPSDGKDGSADARNVLLVGSEHTLDVYHLDRRRFDRIGRLDGLRGSVIGAKILPCHTRVGFQGCGPLVAVVVHGPFVPAESAARPESRQGEEEDFEASNSMLQAMQVADVTHYQTTVEIYSLKRGERVANLFQSPRNEVKLGYDGHLSRLPPIGNLRIHARGRFLTVSSGSSGEIFIFECVPGDMEGTLPHFRCIGKTWTRISSTSLRTASSPSSESGLGGPPDTHGHRVNAAILSLSDRWLAVSPPTSSSHTTLHGQVNVGIPNHKIPGLSSHTPPAEPQATCDLDTPTDESVLNRVARDVAQGALRSAQWVAAEGMQAWNSYWSKPSDLGRPTGSPPNHGFTGAPPPSQNFPPTHAQDDFRDRAKSQPTLVAIIDLEKLSQSQYLKPSLALQPLAAFSLQLGCSALSFSPSGLNLLTGSARGDVQQVWDLMRMVHGATENVGAPDAAPQGPKIRQIARFNRMTEAKIVDVVWTEPMGERFALVTEKGTVHVNSLPPSAFQWPPYRRRPQRVILPKDESKSENRSTDAVRPQSMGSTFGSAFGMITGKTQTALASVRGRSPSVSSGFSGFGSLAMTAGVGAKGGKVVAAGINRSVSAAASGTVRTIRHYGENRLALPVSSRPVSPGCAHWLNGKSQGSIAVTGGDMVRVHGIRQSTGAKVGQRRPSVVADRPVEFSFPRGRPSTQHGTSDNTRPAAEASISPGSFWLPQHSRPTSRKSNLDTHPLSYAEIETNAPYQPFHTDRRVNLFVYDEETATSADPHPLQDSIPWVFGEVIPATQISSGSTKHDEDCGNAASPGSIQSEICIGGNVEDGQRIVSTTTRRKKSRKGEGAEMGVEGDFFEDDCEFLDYAEDRV